MAELEELEVIQASLGALEASVDCLHVPSYADQRFRLATVGDPRVVQIGHRRSNLSLRRNSMHFEKCQEVRHHFSCPKASRLV